jgi:hypothetical protein
MNLFTEFHHYATATPTKKSMSISGQNLKFCGTHGRDSPKCDFMAKWIMAQDAIRNVDSKLNEKFKKAPTNQNNNINTQVNS